MTRLLLGLPLLLLTMAAHAADIHVLTAGAFRPVLEAFAPGFEQRTGNKIVIVTDTAGGVSNRIGRGEAFDIAVISEGTAGDLQRTGKLLVVTPIASTGIGVGVREGAAKPDLTTAEALKAALLAAPSIAMVDPASGGTSGIYVSKLFERLGIADAMRPKLVLTPGGLPAERVANGSASMVLGQLSEIVAVKGVVVAGPLPADLQSRTVYVAGMSPKAAEAPFILLAALAGPDLQALLQPYGMAPP